MAIIDRPIVANDRDLVGFRPLKAIHHFRNLVADKEDTKQVFHIIEALKGRKIHQQAEAFINTEIAQDFMVRENLAPVTDMLDDHDAWSDCGPGTVARTYIDFMRREGLTANGLAEESYAWRPLDQRPVDQVEWYLCRLRDTHDLFHVLTTYGRDALGEAALLGFSFEQNHNLGVKFIAYAAARQIKNVSGTKAPIYAAIKEGRALGKAAAKLAHMDIEAVMRQDIDTVRAELNIGQPVIYRECLRILEAEGHSTEELAIGDAKAA